MNTQLLQPSTTTCPPARFPPARDEDYLAVAQSHHRRLYAATYRILRNHDETEDVIQEAHLRALTHLHQFSGRGPLSAWVMQIAINQALSRLRRRTPSVELDGLPLRSTARDPEQETARRQMRKIIGEAVQALPPKYRSVFMLREVYDEDTAAAAASLGVSVECVKTRLHRAKAILRRRLICDLASTPPAEAVQS